MLDILKFYVSGFWVWCGITIGMLVIFEGISGLIPKFTYTWTSKRSTQPKGTGQ